MVIMLLIMNSWRSLTLPVQKVAGHGAHHGDYGNDHHDASGTHEDEGLHRMIPVLVFRTARKLC